MNNFSDDQTGDYKCTGRNDGGDASVEFSISIKNRLKIISTSVENLSRHRHFSCVVDTELRPVIVIKHKNTTLTSFDTASKDILINSTVYFDKDGNETKLTELKTHLGSGQKHFTGVSRASENFFTIDYFTIKRKPETLRCATEGEDMNHEQFFTSSESPDDFNFVDGEGSKVYVSTALNQPLTLSCRVKSHLQNGVWWFKVGSAAFK